MNLKEQGLEVVFPQKPLQMSLDFTMIFKTVIPNAFCPNFSLTPLGGMNVTTSAIMNLDCLQTAY